MRFGKMKAAIVAAFAVASALCVRAGDLSTGEIWSGTLSQDPENPTRVFTEINDLDELFNRGIDVCGHLGGPGGIVDKDVDAVVKCTEQPSEGRAYQLQVNDYKKDTDCHLKLAYVTFTAKEDGIYACVTGMAYVDNGGPKYLGMEVSSSTPGYHGGATGYPVTSLSYRDHVPLTWERWRGTLSKSSGKTKVFSEFNDLSAFVAGCRLYGGSDNVADKYKGVFVKCAQQPDNGVKYQLQFNDYRSASDCHLKVIEIVFTAAADGIYAEVVRTGYVHNGGPTHLGVEAPDLTGFEYSASDLCWHAQIALGETETVDGSDERAGVVGFGTLVKTGASDSKLSIINFDDANWGFAVEDTTIQIDGGEVCISTVKHNPSAESYDDAKVKDATFIIGENGELTQFGWYNLYGTITFENETDKTVFGASVRTSDGLKLVKRGAGKLTFNSQRATDKDKLNYGIQGLTVEGGQIEFADPAVVSADKLELDFSKLSATAAPPVVGDLALAATTTFKLPAGLKPGQTFALCTGTLSGPQVGTTTEGANFFCGDLPIEADLTITESGVYYNFPGQNLNPEGDFRVSELNAEDIADGTVVGVHLVPGAKLIVDAEPKANFAVYTEDELRLTTDDFSMTDEVLAKIDRTNVAGKKLAFVDTAYVPATAPASGWTYRWEGTVALDSVPYCDKSVSGTVELACPIAANDGDITISNAHHPGYVFDDGLKLTATKFIAGAGTSPNQKFVQRGGEITLTAEYASTAETGSAAPLIFALKWGTFSYDLLGGSLKAENGNTMFGYDGGLTMTVGGGETNALFSTYGVQWDARNNASTLTLNPKGTLRLGAGGIDFRGSKCLVLNGGELEATANATISSVKDISATADSTVTIDENVTLEFATPVTGAGVLTVKGGGTIVVDGTNPIKLSATAGVVVTVRVTSAHLANGYVFDNISVPEEFDVCFVDDKGNVCKGKGNKLFALSKTWIGGASGNWDDAANWNEETVPTQENIVKLDYPVEITLSKASIAGPIFVNTNVTFKGTAARGNIVDISIADGVALTADLADGSVMQHILGPGTLVKTNSGLLYLQNASGSTIDGATIDIRQGTVQLHNNGGSADWGYTTDPLSINPTFIIGADGTLNTYGCILMSGTLTVVNETDKEILKNVGGTSQITGTISLVKKGAGALAFAPSMASDSAIQSFTLTEDAKIVGKGLAISGGSIDLNGHTLTVDATGELALSNTQEANADGGTIVFENGKLANNGGGETHIEHINLVLKDTPIYLQRRICANLITLTGAVVVTGFDRLVFSNPIKVAGGSITFAGETYIGPDGKNDGVPVFDLDLNARFPPFIAKANAGTGAFGLLKTATVTGDGEPLKSKSIKATVSVDSEGAVVVEARRTGFTVFIR